MLLTKLAEPYPGESILEMSKAFVRQKHPDGAEWFISTNGPDFFYTPYPFPSHLFRGQNQYFEPCAPSLNRGLERYSTSIGGMAPVDQGKVILRIAKSHWFARELSKHPAVIWAEENRYTVNRLGLAQHYELETSYVDMSHDFDVAAFFATCQYRHGTWEPVSEGVGVIYIFDLAKSQRCSFKADPVSLQPLPRPSEQKAWLVETPLGADFESHPAVSWVKFYHDEKVSRHYLNLFEGGRKLFPSDPMERVAKKIQQATKIDERIVDNILNQLTEIDIEVANIKAIKDLVSEHSDIVEVSESFMDQEDLEAVKIEWEAKVEQFGRNCTTRPIALVINPPSEEK